MDNVLLINVDSKLPNLALMKLSAYHKAKGDKVGFNISDPNIVYASVIFTKNKHHTDGLKFYYPNAEIHVGGPGVNGVSLPKPVHITMPDYTLFPKMDFNLGFASRGCNRKCKFCMVWINEGKFKRDQHIKDFHKKDFRKVVLLDNNILFDKEWFFIQTDYLLENNLSVDFNQGLDIRLLDDDIAKRIRELNFIDQVRFAWDALDYSDKVYSGIELLKSHGIDLKHKVTFYVLIDMDTNIEQDYFRVNTLRNLECNCFVMPYKQIFSDQPESLGNKHIKDMVRYCNRKWVYWAIPFSEYNKPKYSYLGVV